MVSRGVRLSDTKQLGKELLSSRSHVNNAPILLSILSPDDSASSNRSTSSVKCRLEALRSLLAFFIPLLRSGKFFGAAAKSNVNAEPRQKAVDEGAKEDGKESVESRQEAVYRLWVWSKYVEFKKSLLRILKDSMNSQVLQVAATNALMDLVREERPGEFNNSVYLRLCATMVVAKGENNEILQVLVAKFFKYNDVRYYTYGNLEKLIMKRLQSKEIDLEGASTDEDDSRSDRGVSLDTFVRNVYDTLSNIPSPANDKQKDGDIVDELWSKPSGNADESEKATTSGKEGEQLKKVKGVARKVNLNKPKDFKKQKFVLSKAWLSFLRLSLPQDIYKKVLARLHRQLIPFMANPILLSDFLTQSYNIGGLISVMALSSLFILITKHGLEYPDFYNKLYGLLEPSIFVAKHRSRFFELLDLCLKSSHLPGYLAAAFAKKLGRLAISAPPSGSLVVIALIHNLLRRHPSINCLVHKQESNALTTRTIGDSGDTEIVAEKVAASSGAQTTEERKLGMDPFVSNEADTAKCNALKSSLWEIETLRRHYCPAVSRFVESLETDLTVRAKTTEMTISDFSSASYATIFDEEVGRRLKSVPLAFFQTVPSSLFAEKNSQGPFEGWSFRDVDVSSLNGQDDGKLNIVEETEAAETEEDEKNHSMDDPDSDRDSKDSAGSRSRSEQSEGDDWPQPLLKRIKNR